MNTILAVKKFIQNLRTEKKSLALNLCIIAAAFLSVAALATLLVNVNRVATGAREQFQLTVYLKDGAGKEKVEAIKKAMESFREVRQVKYVSKEDFKGRFLAGLTGEREEMSSLGEEAFPALLEVQLLPEFIENKSATSIVEKLGKIDIVEEVGYHASRMKSLKGLLVSLWIGFGIFSALILISSFLAISNMIQLAFSKRARAIEVMRLCGATRTFMELPVLIEGFFIGLVGGAISLAIAWAAVFVLRGKIAEQLEGFPAFRLEFIPPQITLVLICLCAATGVYGAYIASRKVLRV